MIGAAGRGRIATIDGKMKSQVYQDILQEAIRPLTEVQQRVGDAKDTEGNPPQYGFNGRKYASWGGPVGVLT